MVRLPSTKRLASRKPISRPYSRTLCVCSPIARHLYRRRLLPIMRGTKMHRRTPSMAYETVLYDVADRICTITLNRPEKLNAWTRQMHVDLRDAMQNAGSDPDVRAIILTGAGRGFCAGADMGGLQA